MAIREMHSIDIIGLQALCPHEEGALFRAPPPLMTVRTNPWI